MGMSQANCNNSTTIRHKARERLRRAGAESRPAMQRRVQALAAERSIPPADFHKLMYKRPSTQAVFDFCEKHKVSADWLLCGDLKGLQRMTQEAKASPAADHDVQIFHLGKLFVSLPPQKQKIAIALIDELFTRQRREPEPA
jgi:hypothetical protein